jgi:hypothetical protein
MVTATRKRNTAASLTNLYKGRSVLKRLGEENWKESAYYWWYQCLKRNSAYIKCCENGGKGKLADVYAHMGDVRTNNFWEWWSYRDKTVKGSKQRHELLFKEQAKSIATKLTNKDDWSSEFDDENNYLVLAVNLDNSKRVLHRRFMDEVKRAVVEREKKGIKRKKGRLSKEQLMDSTAPLKITHTFSVPNLQRALLCYDAWVAHKQLPKEKQLKQYQLIDMLCEKEKLLSNLRMSDAVVQRVSFIRWRKEAEGMIENVASTAWYDKEANLRNYQVFPIKQTAEEAVKNKIAKTKVKRGIQMRK